MNYYDRMYVNSLKAAAREAQREAAARPARLAAHDAQMARWYVLNQQRAALIDSHPGVMSQSRRRYRHALPAVLELGMRQPARRVDIRRLWSSLSAYL